MRSPHSLPKFGLAALLALSACRDDIALAGTSFDAPTWTSTPTVEAAGAEAASAASAAGTAASDLPETVRLLVPAATEPVARPWAGAEDDAEPDVAPTPRSGPADRTKSTFSRIERHRERQRSQPLPPATTLRR